MASLKEMHDQATADQMVIAAGGIVLEPYVEPLHTQWLEGPEQDFSPIAIKRGMEVLANQHKVERKGRFSASGLDQCPRRQLFNFAGYKGEPFSTGMMNIMRAGTAAHFWIMMEGLTMGWLVEAEVFFRNADLRMGGTLDGLMLDDSLWEYKSVASSVYSKVSRNPVNSFAEEEDSGDGAKPGHILQTDAYELLTGQPIKSLFYEDRNYGNFHEYRLDHDPSVRAQLLKLLDRLNSWVDDNRLPPMYEDCASQIGKVYHDCPMRKICPTRTTVFD